MRENCFYSFKAFTSFLLIILSFTYQTIAQTNSRVYSKFNINRISTYIYNDGVADIQLNGNSGFEFPKGSNKAANYCGGFIWGGKVNGKIMAGGSSYRSGLNPGKILSNGKADDPISKSSRVYRVRPDYRYADLNMEAKDEQKTVQNIFEQYESDWNEWPAKDGAPFTDVNLDGKYQPSIDIPGIPGANQTLWFVANDLDSTRSKYFTGSLPIGIEMQVTIWGYVFDDTYRGNTLYKKYVLINKSQNEIKEMRLGIWADPDVGDAGDDLVGCDTTLQMVYMFGSKANDATYGSIPPAFGYGLLQGPVVDGEPTDKAIFRNRIITGKKNLPMSALGWIFKSVIEWAEPQLGTDKSAEQIYNALMSKSRSGLDWQIPQRLGGGITRFPFSGDYVKKTGYYDGVEYLPSDRRMMLCMGPFNMAAGDTQEVVFMESAAGADGVTNNLEAIDLLKTNISEGRKEYTPEYKYFTNPAQPKIEVSNQNRKILLSWGDDKEQIKKIEKDKYAFEFQGYNVYQFRDSSYNIDDAEIVATFDKHDGKFRFSKFNYNTSTQLIETRTTLISNDSGVKRHITITNNKFDGNPIINWKNYYFGFSYFSTRQVGQYNYYLESPIVKINSKPNSSTSGIKNTVYSGDWIYLKHTSGESSQYNFRLKVIDPTKFGNYNYELTFKKNSSNLKLNLKNLTTGEKVFEDEEISVWEELPFFDGLALIIDDNYGVFKLLTENDVYQFSTSASVFDKQVLFDDFNKINVFPNPFYGIANHNPIDGSKLVTFTHLPNRAIIKIFNLSGQLVRTIEKNSTEKTVQWNLSNNDGWLIPGGFYVAQIELPDFGKIKTLKMIIVPSSSITPYF